MKLRFQTLWLCAAAGALLLLAMGCNDTLRQFITPIIPPAGDPGALSHAITLSTNPVPSSLGSDMHIDVSGDSSVGTVPLGINPVFLGKLTNRVFIINSGDGTTPPTLSVYLALLPQSATVSTVTLPPTAVNPIGGATSSAGDIYIANSGSNNVSIVSGTVLSVIATLPVGTQPVMIAGNASNNQIFVVNHGSNNVTQISAIDNTVVTGPIAVGTAPVWAVMSTDGLFVFVVNQGSNNVSVIDTSTRAVIATIPVGASPNFAYYESHLQRLYVSNTGSSTISVINANGISATNPPTKLADITVSGTPTSVTALSNGTKAYAALGNCAAGTNHTNIVTNLAGCNGNLVSVIDAVALHETKTITVGTGAISIDASGDASRVFVVNAHDTVTDVSGTHTAGTISDIRTSTDTEVGRKLAPLVDFNCQTTATNFCQVQTPFMVRTFP